MNQQKIQMSIARAEYCRNNEEFTVVISRHREVLYVLSVAYGVHTNPLKGRNEDGEVVFSGMTFMGSEGEEVVKMTVAHPAEGFVLQNNSITMYKDWDIMVMRRK